MATPITRSTVPDALDQNLNLIWTEGLDRWAPEYETVYNVRNSTRQSEKMSYETGFPIMPEKTEGAAAHYGTIYAGPSKTFVMITYALGYEITEEAIEDNQHSAETFNVYPQALMDSADECVDTTAWNILNNGFSDTGPDGGSLFNTAHTAAGSAGTQRNRPDTEADLSVTSLQVAMETMEQWTDEQGKKARCTARLLVVAVPNQWMAEELLKSGKKPYVANNEVNALQMKNLGYFIGHYITDTDSWFLFAQKEKTRLYFFWRVKLGALRRGTDFDSTNLKHLARMRFDVDYAHWIGTYGTQGA